MIVKDSVSTKNTMQDGHINLRNTWIEYGIMKLERIKCMKKNGPKIAGMATPIEADNNSAVGALKGRHPIDPSDLMAVVGVHTRPVGHS
jgi:hypothetical protein